MINEIVIECFEGNITAATDVSTIESKNISHILTLDIVPLPRKITERRGINVMFVKGKTIK